MSVLKIESAKQSQETYAEINFIVARASLRALRSHRTVAHNPSYTTRVLQHHPDDHTGKLPCPSNQLNIINTNASCFNKLHATNIGLATVLSVCLMRNCRLALSRAYSVSA